MREQSKVTFHEVNIGETVLPLLASGLLFQTCFLTCKMGIKTVPIPQGWGGVPREICGGKTYPVIKLLIRYQDDFCDLGQNPMSL